MLVDLEDSHDAFVCVFVAFCVMLGGRTDWGGRTSRLLYASFEREGGRVRMLEKGNPLLMFAPNVLHRNNFEVGPRRRDPLRGWDPQDCQ